MDALGRYGADALGVVSFLSEATRPGGLQSWLANRAALGQDPAIRSYLTQHPNWAGAFGYGTSLQPTDVAPGGPNAATRTRVPNLPALPAKARVEAGTAGLQEEALQRIRAGQGTPQDWQLFGVTMPMMTPEQAKDRAPAGMEVSTYNAGTGVPTYRPERPPAIRSVSPDSQLMQYDPASRQWVRASVAGGGLRGPSGGGAAGGASSFRPPSGMHVGSVRTDKFGRELPTYLPDKPEGAKGITEPQARAWAAGVSGTDPNGQPIKATPEQRLAGKKYLKTIEREKVSQTEKTAAVRAEVKLSSITSTTQTMLETAPGVIKAVERIRRDMAPVATGPWAGRWQDLWAGKIGADDPAFIRLQAELTQLNGLFLRMHVGARGGDTAFAKYEEMVGRGQRTPADMEAALSSIEEYAQEKLSERTAAIQDLRRFRGAVPSGGTFGAGPGPAEPPPAPGGLQLPPGFSVQDVH